MSRTFRRPRGPEAARLRQRKHALANELGLPDDLVAGSLALTHRRCGRPTCHCATDPAGHPIWSLTFMVDGKKRVEAIPDEWVDEVRELVERNKRYKRGLAEIGAANAQLLALWRKQLRAKKKAEKNKKKKRR